MKQYMIACFLFLFAGSVLFAQSDDFRSSAPAPGPAPTIQIGDFTDFKLDNGLHVIVVENDKLPKVSYRLFVDVPLHNEGAFAGAAEMAGDLLRTGTTNKQKAEIDEEIDFIGASLNTFSTGAFGSGLSRHKERLLGIMANVILRPTFPEEEFDKLKRQTLSGLAQAKEDPNQIASNVAQVIRYGADHPYGEIMTEKTVENITVDKCREYYQTYFKPNVSYLVMVGDIKVDEARDLAQQYFGKWASETMVKEYIKKPARPEGTVVDFVPKTGAVQSVINVTYPIKLKPGTMDAIKAQVLNTILGSSFSGRLFSNLREDKAYTYGAYSSMNTDPHIGYFNASASVRNEVTDSSIHEFLYELNRIRTEKVTDAELNRSKNMITGSFARRLESPEAIAQFALNTVRYKLPRDFYPTYLKNVAAVTAADVLEIAQEYITPEQAHVLVVGNKDIVESLQRFATSGEVNYYNTDGVKQELVGFEMPSGLTASTVIANYVKAIGGQEQLNEVEDVTMVMSGSVQGMAMTMTMKRKEPGMMVQKVEMNGMVAQEMRLNGDEAKMLQMGQEMPVEEAQITDLKSQAEIFPEARYEELGYQVELDGVEKVEDKPAYVIKVTSPSGDQLIDYYDQESGLKVRSVVSNEGQTITTDFSDYKEVDGLLFPYKITSSGMMPVPLVFEIQEIAVNSGIDDAEFDVK